MNTVAAKKLSEAREKRNLTQTEMAGLLAERLSQSYSLRQYQKLEQGLFPKYKKEIVIEIDNILKTNLYDLIYEHIVPRGDQVDAKGPEPYLQKRFELKNNSSPFMVPFVPVAAQAGYAKNFYDMAYIEKLETYPILPGIDPHGAQWRYFQVKGRSMLETFKEGQFILASQVIKDDWRNIENFYVYCIVTDEGVMVKRLAKVKGKDYWAAISDNDQEFKQFKLPVADVKELWKYRRHVDWDAGPKKKFEITV